MVKVMRVRRKVYRQVFVVGPSKTAALLILLITVGAGMGIFLGILALGRFIASLF